MFRKFLFKIPDVGSGLFRKVKTHIKLFSIAAFFMQDLFKKVLFNYNIIMGNTGIAVPVCVHPAALHGIYTASLTDIHSVFIYDEGKWAVWNHEFVSMV